MAGISRLAAACALARLSVRLATARVASTGSISASSAMRCISASQRRITPATTRPMAWSMPPPATIRLAAWNLSQSSPVASASLFQRRAVASGTSALVAACSMGKPPR